MGSNQYTIHLVFHIGFHSKERKKLLDTKLNLSINKQCKLLKINKSSLYYQPIKPFSKMRDIEMLDSINNIYEAFPSYGYRRITKELQNEGYNVNRKRVQKAMRYMDIEALYPKPKTTTANKEHYNTHTYSKTLETM